MSAPAAPGAPAGEKKHSPAAIILAVVAGCFGLFCVVSIVAAIAIPAFVRYVKRSKTAEAEMNVRALVVGAQLLCEDDLQPGYPTVPAGPLPARPSSMTQAPGFAADPTFAALGFTPIDPVYYSYSVVPDGVGGLTLRANGDLDDDGVLSTFESNCDASCACSPIHVVNELE